MNNSEIKRVVIENLHEGTDLYKGIARIAGENKIGAGRVTGTGSVKRARMSTYDQKTMQHSSVEVLAPMEIVSLYGEVVLREGEPIPRIHIVLADIDGNGKGGHLIPDTTPVLACEVRIEEYDDRPNSASDSRLFHHQPGQKP